MLSMSLLLLAGSALRLRRHRHGWLAAVLLLFLASLVGMGTIWSIARTPKVSDQVVTSADGIDMKLQVVQRRSLLRTDETVEVYATDNDMIERTWMVWRAAGRGPIQLRFSDAHQVEVVDGRGVVYRSDLSVGDFRPSPQRCLRTVRCGEAN